MSVTEETSLSNVTVQVATPPPLPEIPPMPQETLEPTFYAYSDNYSILDDSVQSLMGFISKKQHIREVLIKGNRESEETTTAIDPPPPVAGAFGEIPKYYTTHMPGIKLSAQQGQARGYVNIPTGLFIKASGSIISMPYFPRDPGRLRNGVLNNSKTVNPFQTTYLWKSLNPLTDARNGNIIDALQPRPDGAVEMAPQPRAENNPRKEIALTPHVYEIGAGLKNETQLNAFSLILGIVPGCSGGSSNPPPWRITISFGEVLIHIDEGSSTLEVTINGSEPRKIFGCSWSC